MRADQKSACRLPDKKSATILILSIALGALLGWDYWPRISSLALARFGVIYRGFPSILYDFLGTIGLGVGAIIGMALVLPFVKASRVATSAFVLATIVLALWLISLGFESIGLHGKRFASVVYGFPLIVLCGFGALEYVAFRVRGRSSSRQS